MANLHPDHKADLEKSGLTEETIRTSNVYSVPPNQIDKILGRNSTPVKSLLAIPYLGTDFIRYKIFPPCKLSKSDLKPRKYLQPPGSPIHLYEPPGFDRNLEVIRITEGEKKALKGTQEELNVCGLGGIWNFGFKDEDGKIQLIEALKQIDWTNKTVELIPDGDFQLKDSVCHAVYRLGTILEKEGAKVGIIPLPGNAKLDDYLCTHSVEAFSKLELLTLDDPIFRTAKVKEYGFEVAIASSCINLESFLAMSLPPRPFIMKPWLRPGTLAMIYSFRGVGKTMLAIAIALCITRKVSIGNWVTETPTGCLYIDGEMPSEELQDRLKKLAVGLPDELAPLTILSSELMERHKWPRPNLVDPKWREAIYSYLIDGVYKVLILDNLASLTPGIDENIKKEGDDINQWYLSIRFLGVAVILIHHAGKGGDQRGSSAREDNLDISIKLSHPAGYRPEDGCKFDVTFTKARSVYGAGATPFSFQIVEKDGFLTWGIDAKGSGSREMIIAMLGKNIPQKEIVDILECDKGWVSRVKRKAIGDGYLTEQGKFTPKGEKEFGGVNCDGWTS